MTDLPSLSAAFASAKTAFDLAKMIHDSSSTLEKAEMKLRLAELFGALADVKMQLVELQDDVAARTRRIAELEQAFESKAAMQRVNDAYYHVDANFKPHGNPLCLRCWEVDRKQRQLIQSPKNGRGTLCPACNTEYKEAWTGRIE